MGIEDARVKGIKGKSYYLDKLTHQEQIQVLLENKGSCVFRGSIGICKDCIITAIGQLSCPMLPSTRLALVNSFIERGGLDRGFCRSIW